MDKEYRLKIIQNLDFIAANVSSLTRLLNLLLQESVISQVEVETIESHTPRYKAVTELANLMCKKDTKKFPVFIRCLNESGNASIAKKLMAHCTVVQQISEQIWFGITAPSKLYVGREKEMELLQKYWNECLENETLSIVAITGLGGVGKTELTKNFAKWFHKTVKGHCFWVETETPQSLVESFHNLAKELKISLNDDLGKEKIFQEIVKDVYEKLFGEKVLFVFDNVENYELPVFQLLMDLSSKKPPTILKPFVITTSRLVDANNYFGSECSQIDLQVLPKDSAMQFFRKSLSLNEPRDITNELIGKLFHRLQYFPLAMQQATAYIKERSHFCGNISEAINNYLTQIEMQTKALLNYRLPQYEALGVISKSTLFTWRITFDKLREPRDSGELAVDIMNIISFLSPDNIPTQMVARILQKTEKISNIGNVDNLFEHIRKYSLINFSEEKSISVHRLVQEVTRIELEERGEFPSILSGVTTCLEEMLTGKEISLKDLIHVRMVWLHLKRDKAMIEEHGKILGLLCQKYLDSGRYRDLLEFSIESEDFLESLFGQNSRGTMKMKYFKGAALSRLGEYSASIEVLKYSYEKQKEVFGEEDEDCLVTAYEVGLVYWRSEKYAEAMNIYKDTLEKVERIQGKEHRRTLELKHDIALVLRGQNKLNEAVRLYEEVLEEYKRFFGVEDPDTLTTKHNIAYVKLIQKKYLEALKEFQDVLEIKERVLELSHPSTSITKLYIAVIYYYLGRLERSLQLFKEVHESCVEILGPRHPRTIDTEEWIASVEKKIALQRSITEL